MRGALNSHFQAMLLILGSAYLLICPNWFVGGLQAAHQQFNDNLTAARQQITATAVNKDTSEQLLAEVVAARKQADECLRLAEAAEAGCGREVQQHITAIQRLTERRGDAAQANNSTHVCSFGHWKIVFP